MKGSVGETKALEELPDPFLFLGKLHDPSQKHQGHVYEHREKKRPGEVGKLHGLLLSTVDTMTMTQAS
jgi:hypothetical protein